MPFRHPLRALGALALSALALAATPARADQLVDHVNGLTMDQKGQVVRFTGLVISPEGKVVQLLRSGERPPRSVTSRVDGGGRVMLPGLIDAHGHVMGLGFQALTLDLTGARSLNEALSMVRAYAAANPDKKWIIGRGWNQEQWGLNRFPTAAELDAAVSDRPVWLGRVDGHAGWANSAAMKMAGVTAATRSPAGGHIENGIFIDAATDLIASKLPQPRPAERDLALAKAQEALLAHGVTAIADMGTTIEDWQSFRRAGDAGWLMVRIMSYARSIPDMVLIAGQHPTPWLYDDRLHMGGLKLYLDGALGSRGAWLKRPYADAPGSTGLPLLAPAELRNNMSRAAMDGFQVAVHAIGDAANAELLSAIDELSETYGGDRRWRIEHAQIVDPADIPRFGKHGVIASMQPIHATSDRLMAEQRLGPDRLAGAYAWHSLAAAGARLAFGSDTPVEAPDPFAGFAAAITREDAQGQPFGGWLPQERVSREQAFAAYTIGAAYAGFAEGRFGSLMPGNRADFVLTDVDPMLASPADIRQAKVIQVWIGGRPAWPFAPANPAPSRAITEGR